jgi:F-type H+-transporting ATPase subunit epsilon
MHLEILTPKKALYSEEILVVKLPGAKGSFEILKNHAPIISSLEKGIIVVKDTNSKTFQFEISGGVAECKDNKIIVLASEGSSV